jgi:hypothetical protein
MTPLPGFAVSNADSRPYWEAADEGRLVFKRCCACGHVQFPPRHLCPKCWSEKAEWIASAGKGSVHSFTVVRRAPRREYAERVPYVLAVIDLDDAPRMMANIVGSDALEVRTGDKVGVTFEPRDGGTLPQFKRL